MSPRASELLQQALQLPLDERADLAAEIIASMDGEPDEDVEAAWAEEIERRARRVLSGGSRGEDWEIVRARIEASLNRK